MSKFRFVVRAWGSLAVLLSIPTLVHAAELSFIHPLTGEHLNITSPLPGDIARLLEILADN